MQAEEELAYLENLLVDDYFALREVVTNLNVMLYFLAKEKIVPHGMGLKEFEEVAHLETEGHVLDNLIPLVREHLDCEELEGVMKEVKELHYRALDPEEELGYEEVRGLLERIRAMVEGG